VHEVSITDILVRAFEIFASRGDVSEICRNTVLWPEPHSFAFVVA
jgi:hypothetical protein